MTLQKSKLLKMEELWLAEGDDTDEWFEKGINIYKELRRIDPFNYAKYSKSLANLMIEQARNEKMLHGNILTAERLLKEVIDIESEHSEIYYRLAFINEHNKKWEAVLFYANEALDYGISLDEEIKLSALMGYAYTQISLRQRGKNLFDHAESLDTNNEWTLFIDNYRELANRRIPISKKAREEKDDSIAEALEHTRANRCCVLSVYSADSCLITSTDEISLSSKEAELLAFLVQNNDQSITSSKLQSNIWPMIDNPNTTVVKKTISSLRKKCFGAFGNEDNQQDLIVFEQNGYYLQFPVEVKIFKGLNFRRLSCR